VWKIDFGQVEIEKISALYFFLEMLSLMAKSQRLSSDMELRRIIRNFGDDFVKIYIAKFFPGSIGYQTSVWHAMARCLSFCSSFVSVHKSTFGNSTQFRFLNYTFI
jgi:hypothetical protein